MSNKAQVHAKRLLKILSEDKYKRKRAPIILSVGLVALIILTITFYKKNHLTKESYLISREERLSFNDIDSAIKGGVDLEAIGDEKRHILYYLAKGPYSLEILSYLKKSGINLQRLDSKKKNVLENILLDLDPDIKSLEEHFYKNISTLLSLELVASEETIKEVSKKCESNSTSTCLKMAFYFKALNKPDHARSYAKRSCYTSSDKSICELAKNYILKD